MTNEQAMATQAVARSDLGQMLWAEFEALPSASRLNAEQLEIIYALAYTHVAQQQYGPALEIFELLCLYGPTRRHYLMGLALCLHKLGHYDKAVNMYCVVLTLYPDTWEAALQMAECQVALGQSDDAQALLHQLSLVGQRLKTQPAWLGRAQVLHSGLMARDNDQ